MDPDPSSSLLIIFGSLLASAFFSGMEIAFVSANRLQLELDAKQHWQGALLAHLARRPQWMIATLLVGNNLALVFCGMESGDLIARALFAAADWNHAESPVIALATQTAMTTAVVLVLAEFLPKSLFHANPNRWLKLLAVPLAIAHYSMLLPGLLVVGLSQISLRLLGGQTEQDGEEREPMGATDLDHFIREMSGRMEPEQELEHELQIMQNALEFNKVRARDCLIPRNEVVAVELNTDMSSLRGLFVETGLSKIVIYRGDIDNVVGYVHSRDLFKRPEKLTTILHSTFVIPEPMPADEVLRQFIRRRKHLAVVVDEFGGTSGILTMEDIVEQIVGDIEDEHDVEVLVEEQIEPGIWRLSARLEVETVNEKYAVQLPLNDAYETLGGMVLYHTETIPAPGFTWQLNDLIVEVEQVDSNRIETIRLHLNVDE